MPAVEDHRLCVAALALLAVDVEPHGKPLRVLDLVLGDQPWPKRAESLAAFALSPLTSALDLEYALGDIVGEAISGDHVERLVLGQITPLLSDHDAELDFPIELGRSFGNDGVIVGPADAGGRLVEDDRLLGNGHSRFRRVIGIIEPNGDKIADTAHTGPEARVPRNEGQFVHRLLAYSGQAFR